LSKIKPLEPDVIFIPSYYQEAGLIATQARQQGMQQTLIGGDGWDSPQLIQIGGQAVEHCFFVTHSCSTAQEPVMQKFAQAYQAKYGREPDALAALAYDALYIVVDAIRRAGGAAEPRAIRDAVAQTKDLQGATGTITIDAQRNARKAAYALLIEGGNTIFYKKIEPEKSTLAPAAAPSTSAGKQ
jgi:branched-chain amino acid transport system substrate-binding protein